jgi:hypothetical protein
MAGTIICHNSRYGYPNIYVCGIGIREPSPSSSWLKGWFTWTNILTNRTSITAAGGIYSANFTNPEGYYTVYAYQEGFGNIFTRKLRLSVDYNVFNFSTGDGDLCELRLTFTIFTIIYINISIIY